MKILLTGNAGHLGETLARTLAPEHEVVGLDVQPSPFTTVVGSIADVELVARAMRGVQAVLHTATLHKPHVVTHARREFVDTNIVGTLTLLEAAAAAAVRSFIYTSTTSVYGRALAPDTGSPAAWITEDVMPLPKNIYGVTKKAAEDLCELFHRTLGLPCLVLRTSRFFPDQRARLGTALDVRLRTRASSLRRRDPKRARQEHRLQGLSRWQAHRREISDRMTIAVTCNRRAPFDVRRAGRLKSRSRR